MEHKKIWLVIVFALAVAIVANLGAQVLAWG